MQVKQRSAGVIPVRRDPEAPRVLVLRSWRNWDFPKGLVEPGEDLLATAIREAEEEAALIDLTFPWGRVYAQTEPYGKGKVATYFVADVPTRFTEVVLPVSPELGHPEHHEGRWLPFAEAFVLLPRRLQPILTWAMAIVSGGAP